MNRIEALFECYDLSLTQTAPIVECIRRLEKLGEGFGGAWVVTSTAQGQLILQEIRLAVGPSWGVRIKAGVKISPTMTLNDSGQWEVLEGMIREVIRPYQVTELFLEMETWWIAHEQRMRESEGDRVAFVSGIQKLGDNLGTALWVMHPCCLYDGRRDETVAALGRSAPRVGWMLPYRAQPVMQDWEKTAQERMFWMPIDPSRLRFWALVGPRFWDDGTKDWRDPYTPGNFVSQYRKGYFGVGTEGTPVVLNLGSGAGDADEDLVSDRVEACRRIVNRVRGLPLGEEEEGWSVDGPGEGGSSAPEGGGAESAHGLIDLSPGD